MDIHRAAPEDLDRIDALLAGASLPPLPRNFPLSDVFVGLEGGAVVGVVALEVLGLVGVVRAATVAVGVADPREVSSLLQAMISRANELSLRALYLFFEDAVGSGVLAQGTDGVFAKAGFSPVAPDALPSEIRSAPQYREQVSKNAAVMCYQLATRYV